MRAPLTESTKFYLGLLAVITAGLLPMALTAWLRWLADDWTGYSRQDFITTITVMAQIVAVAAAAAFTWFNRSQLQFGRRGFRMTLAAALGLLIIAALLPPVSSADSYWNALVARGFTQRHLNPYVSTAADFSADPLFAMTAPEWQNLHLMYGPIWIWFSAAPASLLSEPMAAAVAIKVFLVLTYILAGWLISRELRRAAPATAGPFLIFWLLNPLAVLEVANGGHSDGLVILALAVFAVGLQRRRPDVALPALAAASLIKFWPGVMIIALLGLRDASWRRWFVGAMLAAGLTVAAFAPFWAQGAPLPAILSQMADIICPTWFAPGFFLLWHLAVWFGATFLTAMTVAKWSGWLLAVVAWSVIAILTRRGRLAPLSAAALAAAVFLTWPLHWLQPWYFLIFLPLLWPSDGETGLKRWLALMVVIATVSASGYAAPWGLTTWSLIGLLATAAWLRPKWLTDRWSEIKTFCRYDEKS